MGGKCVILDRKWVILDRKWVILYRKICHFIQENRSFYTGKWVVSECLGSIQHFLCKPKIPIRKMGGKMGTHFRQENKSFYTGKWVILYRKWVGIYSWQPHFIALWTLCRRSRAGLTTPAGPAKQTNRCGRTPPAVQIPFWVHVPGLLPECTGKHLCCCSCHPASEDPAPYTHWE